MDNNDIAPKAADELADERSIEEIFDEACKVSSKMAKQDNRRFEILPSTSPKRVRVY